MLDRTQYIQQEGAPADHERDHAKPGVNEHTLLCFAGISGQRGDAKADMDPTKKVSEPADHVMMSFRDCIEEPNCLFQQPRGRRLLESVQA